jgi:hypothetical protein
MRKDTRAFHLPINRPPRRQRPCGHCPFCCLCALALLGLVDLLEPVREWLEDEAEFFWDLML